MRLSTISEFLLVLLIFCYVVIRFIYLCYTVRRFKKSLKNINFEKQILHLPNYLLIFFSLFIADFRFKGRFAIAHSNPHEGGQALQVCPMQQGLCQF